MKSVFSFTTVFVAIQLILSLQISAAATTLTPHNFIATAKNDTSIKAHKDMKFQLEDAPADTPYIERVELRAGIDDLDQMEQTYQLRFYPRAWGETSRSRKLTEIVSKADPLDETLYLCRAVKKRYQLVLEYIQAQELLKVFNSLKIVHMDRINVLQQKSATEIDYDISSLITAEDKLTKLQLDLLELKSRITDLEITINRLAGYECDISFGSEAVIQMETIAEIIEDIKPQPENDNIYLKRQKYKIELARSELELEKARNRDYISFFQISHSFKDSDENWEEKTSAEIGIKLPLIRSDRESVWRRKAVQKREEYQYEQEIAITLEKIAKLRIRLKNSLAQYNLLQTRNQKGNARRTFDKHLAMEGVDPLDLLNLKESILEKDIRLSEFTYDIRSDFIELMELLGRLTREPLTDYLSNKLEKIL